MLSRRRVGFCGNLVLGGWIIRLIRLTLKVSQASHWVLAFQSVFQELLRIQAWPGGCPPLPCPTPGAKEAIDLDVFGLTDLNYQYQMLKEAYCGAKPPRVSDLRRQRSVERASDRAEPHPRRPTALPRFEPVRRVRRPTGPVGQSTPASRLE